MKSGVYGGESIKGGFSPTFTKSCLSLSLFRTIAEHVALLVRHRRRRLLRQSHHGAQDGALRRVSRPPKKASLSR